MPATLRRLLDHPDLGLTLLTTPRDQLDSPIDWVHSTDLVDPTPFLGPAQVLVTTGIQRGDESVTDADYAAYVGRLVARGILGLGFGTEVIRAGTPEVLIAECEAQGLALFEVPYRVPFIAVIQAVARVQADELYARQRWAYDAQRAISRAALRPDGLSATLRELSRQLGRAVSMFDRAGTLSRIYPDSGNSAAGSEAVGAEARRLLGRGRRAGSTILSEGEPITLQTLGRNGELRGVLAISGAGELDQESQAVVTSVIAMAELALAQSDDLDRARGHLRTGLLQALLDGNIALVDATARQMWGPLPAEPVRVAALAMDEEAMTPTVEALELLATSRAQRHFHGLRGSVLVVLWSDGDDDVVIRLGNPEGLTAGVSDAVPYAGIAEGLSQALQSLERAQAGQEHRVDFADLTQAGMFSLLGREESVRVANGMLEPLLESDRLSGTRLVESVAVWLENNGQFDAAARELGVHRHTVRARISQIERLLQRDLGGFNARADVWAALVATARTPRERR